MGLLAPALAAPSAAVTADGSVLGCELVPVVAVGAPGVSVAKVVGSSGAPSPVSNVGGTLSPAFGSGQPCLRCLVAMKGLAGAAEAMSSWGLVGVFWRVFMTLRAVSFVRVVVVAMLNSILTVARRGVPAQVLQAIVGRAAVVVTPLHSWRAGADERFQYQLVDLPGPASNRDDRVPATVEGGLEVAALMLSLAPAACVDYSVEAFGLAEVADFVVIFRSDDRFPDFRHALKCTEGSDTVVGFR